MREILNALRKKEIDVILMIILLVSGASLFILVNCGDELWNFANCYKMFNGYKIYDELNVIITPLFFYIAQIFFKIFGQTLLAFRIYNIFISTIFIMLIYALFKSLKVVRRRAIFYTVIVMFVLNSMIASGANYNILVMIPILIAIILIIKEKENSVLLGLLLFLTFVIKQNVYIFFSIGIFIYKFINRKNIKSLFIELFKIYSISIIGILIFLIYLYFDNNLYNFINYCFLGISEFGDKNIGIVMSGARYLYISIFAVCFSLFVINNKKTNKNIDNITIENTKKLLSFGIPLLLIAFPIINYYHATLSSVIIFIEFIYLIENILIKELQMNRKKEKIIYVSVIILYMLYLYSSAIIGAIEINKGEIVFNNNGAFFGSMISKEDNEDIQTISNYVKEKEREGIDVKILSYKANLYVLNLNKNNGIFDMPFLGNLGTKGEKGLIDDINQLENTIILIQTDSEKVFYQESKNARNYIINNYNKIGEIQEFSAYYIQNKD